MTAGPIRLISLWLVLVAALPFMCSDSAAARPALTAGDIRDFLNHYVPQQLKSSSIPGAWLSSSRTARLSRRKDMASPMSKPAGR